MKKLISSIRTTTHLLGELKFLNEQPYTNQKGATITDVNAVIIRPRGKLGRAFGLKDKVVTLSNVQLAQLLDALETHQKTSEGKLKHVRRVLALKNRLRETGE